LERIDQNLNKLTRYKLTSANSQIQTSSIIYYCWNLIYVFIFALCTKSLILETYLKVVENGSHRAQPQA